MKLFFVVLALLPVLGCSDKSHEDPAPVIRPQEGSELCDEACDVMLTKLKGSDGGIGCEVALPVPVQDGGTVECQPDAGTKGCITCEEWCLEQHANGIFWNTECISKQISTCEEVESVCNIQ